MNTPTSIAAQIPVGRVMAWCAPWLALIALLLFISQVGNVRIPHETYKFWRNLGVVVLILFAIIGILRSLDVVGEAQAPWYTIPFLVSLVLFWGLFPPTWFFLEYLLFDRGVFELPTCPNPNATVQSQITETNCKPPTKEIFLPALKVYADMASKIWGAIGVAIGVAIGLAKRA